MKHLNNYQKTKYFFFLIILLLFTGGAFLISGLNMLSIYIGIGVIIIYSAAFYAIKLSNLPAKTKYLIKTIPLILISSTVAFFILWAVRGMRGEISISGDRTASDAFIYLFLFISGVFAAIQFMFTSFLNKSSIENNRLITKRIGYLINEIKISNYKYIIADKTQCYLYFLKDKKTADKAESCINYSAPRDMPNGINSSEGLGVDELFSLDINNIIADLTKSDFVKAKETEYLIVLSNKK